MLALYREAAALLGRDSLRYTYTTDCKEASYLTADPDVEVLWRDGMVFWYESEEQRRELDELGVDGDIVTLWTVARWTSPSRPRRERVPSTPYPFTSVVVRLVRALSAYPDAGAGVRPHLFALRTREGALAVIQRLADAERQRQGDLQADAGVSEDRAHAAWWRYENPLPVPPHHDGERSDRPRQGQSQAGSAGPAKGLDVERLRRDRSYVDRVIARWLHDDTERTLAAAFRSVEREVGDAVPAYPSADAFRESLRRREINVGKMKAEGEKAFD